MSKVIKIKELRDRENNLKLLKILIDRYVEFGKKRVFEKVIKEQ